jgi:hypothetical protein
VENEGDEDGAVLKQTNKTYTGRSGENGCKYATFERDWDQYVKTYAIFVYMIICMTMPVLQYVKTYASEACVAKIFPFWLGEWQDIEEWANECPCPALRP